MTTKTKHLDIVNFWEGRIPEDEMGCDKADMLTHCWRCDVEKKQGIKSKLEKCHIVPASCGGKDTPANLILLCSMCHKEAPNVNSTKAMFVWIKATLSCSMLPRRHWEAAKAAKSLYNYDVLSELDNISNKCEGEIDNILDFAKIELDKSFKDSTIHFGTGGCNESTLAFILMQLTKEIKQKFTL